MTTLAINRGSDLLFDMRWKNSDRTPMDLTSATVEVFEPHAKLAGHITLTVEDAVEGLVGGRVEWQDDMPSGRNMSFRVRVNVAGNDISTRAMLVAVQ